MKSIGYIRVSTDKQTEGVSLKNQQARIKKYTEFKDMELVDILEDVESGGKNKAREGFVHLLDQLERHDIGAIIVYSLERLSRDMLTLLALERLLDEYNVELHTVDGQIDTSTPNGFMNFAMNSFMGEMERRQIKYRTKRALQYKKQKGEVVGSVPYGFKRNGIGLVECANEQKVIAYANRLYLKGHSIAHICRELADNGYKTRTGKDFYAQQVKRLLCGYVNKWSKNTTQLSSQIRNFVTSVA